jgi:hypothetical protein
VAQHFIGVDALNQRMTQQAVYILGELEYETFKEDSVTQRWKDREKTE